MLAMNDASAVKEAATIRYVSTVTDETTTARVDEIKERNTDGRNEPSVQRHKETFAD
jgi:hypothetical protein